MRISTITLIGFTIGCQNNIKSSSTPAATTTNTAAEDADSTDEPSDEQANEPSDAPDPEPADEPADESSDEPSDENNQELGEISFTKVLLANLPGTSWLHPVDLNGDGYDEILATSKTVGIGDWPTFIGAGAGYILSRDDGAANGSLGSWTVATAFDRTFQIDWPNDSSMFDVNNDGVDDWVIGTGFTPLPDGGFVWMEGSMINGTLTFDIPDIIEVPRVDHFYHKAHPVDLDGDGDMDFVTTSHTMPTTNWLGNETAPGQSILEWYENDGVIGTASFTQHDITFRGGALMELHDVDADGDMDVILPQYFEGNSLIWMENPGNPNMAWAEHLINSSTGRGFEVQLADINQDGLKDIVYVNHNHQGSSDPSEQIMGVYWFEMPPPSQVKSMSNWDSMMNVVYEGFYVDEADTSQNGAPGLMNVGDIDGNGLMDISVSGDGDDGLYLFRQRADHSFEEIIIDSGTAMAGDHHMADLDGDGDMDFIWAIYGSQNIFAGEFNPQSEINVYLQESGSSTEMSGALNFDIQTDYGPDSCSGTISLGVNERSLQGSYECGLGIIGMQNNPVRGSIDTNGNITGEIDVTVSFSGETYPLEWSGTYTNGQVTTNTTGSAQLGTMDVDYTLGFTAN